MGMQSFSLLENEKYVTFGRTVTGEKGTALFWTGSGVEFNICAGCLYVNIECGYDNIEIMLDIILEGERTQKLVLQKGEHRYPVFSGMSKEKPINVRILRDTQCMTEEKNHYLIIKSFETDGELTEPPHYNYNIEFIGDSLTSGEGCGLTRRMEWVPVIFDATETYAYKTAQILNARYSILSQSGWGLYASWDANLNNVLPDYYDQICGTSGCDVCKKLGAHSEWDFNKIDMDAVIINLGTNDSGALKTGKFENNGFLKEFKAKGINFLKNIRKKNDSCQIIWAYGMLGADMESVIEETIKEYKKETKDIRVEYLRLPECKGEDLGVRSHPTPAAHAKVAKRLVDYLQSTQVYLLR